ncbi:peptidoglycan D,D-transpeptidase FtsI family protein [Sphingomonas astaxanthinifaciens]|uniref:Peptidoglycan glycosyltransferase n=1 Tax=Sphingomonas astaxanthinifaciens DSM 22298 TaxID=1123267 RepID=A0ABQ5Z5C6_9SPHN|nr:penicillin-binding protein 2 [Sphingomonas astaxanthinifaciens]GLR47207.1 peptidoglycan glycosyltransferase [Sphingomonas astaxanthinifaciens DSM 22298]
MNAPTPALVARPERLRLVGQRRQLLAVIHQRLMVGMLVFMAVAGAIILRLTWLGLFGTHAGAQSGPSALIPARGDIVDRNGQPLARTIDSWTVALQPAKVIGEKRALAVSLARLMPEKDVAGWLAEINSKKSFIYLRRRAAPNLVTALNALGEPGIALSREPDRLYPQTDLAAHVLGYTNIDGHGAAGMERAFDKYLSDPATRGQPLTLSISSPVQQALEHELLEAKATFNAIGAAGVLLDIHTGEVLAMTSLPQLNPNVAGNMDPEAQFNRATLGAFELGSTFKPFTVAMAMEVGTVKSMGQIYPCYDKLSLPGGRIITDTHPFGRPCSVAEIMMESSNIGTAQIAAQVGGERQREFLRKMTFLGKPEIELPERGRALTIPAARWNPATTMTVGFGHSIAVTPLHLAIGYATLYNGGIYRPATLLKVGPGHPVARGTRVFSEETSYKSRALLRLVVMKGTGKKADAIGYRVGGKTGTAEKVINGRYSKTVNITSFAGVFPMDEPRYAMVVMLDEPKATADTYGFRTAGWNAAPTFGKVVARIAPMLGVRPDLKRDANMSEVLPFVREEK